MEAARNATDPKSGHVKLELMDRHLMESKNFQIEDMWICEKVQRGLRSPARQVGTLATGAGAESTITTFHKNILDFVGTE
jgi:choline monooxygenase